MKNRVCILTTVHPPLDPRVFYKEALSLKKAGYDVTLIAPEEKSLDIREVWYVPIPRRKGRWRRVFGMSREAVQRVIEIKPDIIHIHDPELIIRIPFLKEKTGAKIVYDIHEDIQSQIMEKDWIPKSLRFIVAKLYGIIEFRYLKLVDYIILAEISYTDLYKGYQNKVIIRNKALVTKDFEIRIKKDPTIAYIGFISKVRGSYEMLRVVQILKKDRPGIKLELIGEYGPEIKRIIKEYDIEENVNIYGFMPINKANLILKEASVGLSLVKPSPNYSFSELGKIFDYMNAGIPVVASDIPVTKEIVSKAKCGKIVDPDNIEEIVEAINYLLDNPEEALEFGQRGRRYLVQNYDWKSEEEKLLDLYEKLLKDDV